MGLQLWVSRALQIVRPRAPLPQLQSDWSICPKEKGAALGPAGFPGRKKPGGTYTSPSRKTRSREQIPPLLRGVRDDNLSTMKVVSSYWPGISLDERQPMIPP